MGLVWRGRRNGGDERKRERERERKEERENGMLKGTERGKFISFFFFLRKWKMKRV